MALMPPPWLSLLLLGSFLVQGDASSLVPRRGPRADMSAQAGATASPFWVTARTTAPQPEAGADPVWQSSLEAALRLAGDGRKLPAGRAVGMGGSSTAAPSAEAGGSSMAAAAGAIHASTVTAPQRRQAARSVTVNVAINQGRYRISPWIYGVNDWSNWTAIKDAGIRLVRRGGNPHSRYNWAIDTTNRAADWYFQSLPDSWDPNVNAFEEQVQGNIANGVATIATIPVLGWLPKSRTPSCSFNSTKYGAFRRQAPDRPECGDGYRKNGWKFTQNDPRDANVWTDESHQAAWMQNLTAKYGTAKNGGIRFYCIDNEPVWWSYNHWDVHPSPSSYDEIVEKALTFAPLIKKADPSALILGPVTGGWADTFFSIKDMQAGWGTYPYKYWSNPVDRKAHGNKPFIQYYLEMMRAYQQRTGTRILDIVDLHAYVLDDNANTDPASQARRIDAVRIFWDPQFKCSYCDFMDPITAPDGVPRFISRVKEIIRKASPGVGIAFTEYALGGDMDVSGAIAQAELLGVFGKTGVALATYFLHPTPESSTYFAFKMFGNFDGRFGRFGNLGVKAASSDRLSVSAYAALNTRNRRLTVLIINLKPEDARVTVNFNDFNVTRRFSVFQYSSANLKQIMGLPAMQPSQSVTMVYPGYSLTMLATLLA